MLLRRRRSSVAVSVIKLDILVVVSLVILYSLWVKVVSVYQFKDECTYIS